MGMEAYLLDVGQGTSNVLVLGNQEAIVIDSGLVNDRTLFQLLQRLGIARIRHLVISHNDSDHLGGAVGLLDHFEGSVDEVWFVNDTKLMASRFWERLNEQRLNGVMDASQWHRLERHSEPVVIYSDPATGIRLEVFAPTFALNLLAQVSKAPNATSGVLAVRCGAHSIVFGGDATLAEWRLIEQLLKHPIECDVLAVPHHAGDIGIQSAADLQWLYSAAVKPKVAVVSVGTANNFGHPREDVIQEIRKAKAKVMCTQLTKKCCDLLEELRPGVIDPHTASRSSRTRDVTSSGNSRHVACAGTVVVELDQNGVRVERKDSHDRRIDRLMSQGKLKPICRP
jgi:competence protein ComEC